MTLRVAISAIAASLFLTLPATAAPILAGYPAPGGTSYASSGSVLHGTATWTYSEFDPSAFDLLWWGIEDIALSMDGAIDAVGETLSLSSMNGSTAIWSGLTEVVDGPVETRMVATILSGGSDWIAPASVDIPGPVQAVSQVDGSVDFIVEAAIQARFAGTTTWQPYLLFFDANTGAGEDGNARSSYYRNFYYEPATVPLPGSLTLAAGALGMLTVFSRRRHS